MIGDAVVEEDNVVEEDIVVEDGTVVKDDTGVEEDAVVEDNAVDYLHQCYIKVYEMFAHKDAQKADDMLQEENRDMLE